MGTLVVGGNGALLQAHRSSTDEVKRVKSLTPPSPGVPGVAEVYTLSVDSPLGKERMKGVAEVMKDLKIESFVSVMGLSAAAYKNEQDEMDQQVLPMTEQQKKEWLQVDIGYGPVHKGKKPAMMGSSGALACSLGHRHIWETALDMFAKRNSSDERWALIVEDDVRVRRRASPSPEEALREALASVPAGVDIVFLDDRHCWGRSGELGQGVDIYLQSSQAYAITAKGARALLSEPFKRNADHWLNIPVHDGKIRGFCPKRSRIVFAHEYKHASMIKSNAAKLNLLSVFGLRVDYFRNTRVVRRRTPPPIV